MSKETLTTFSTPRLRWIKEKETVFNEQTERYDWVETGEKVLQYYNETVNQWLNVPEVEE